MFVNLGSRSAPPRSVAQGGGGYERGRGDPAGSGWPTPHSRYWLKVKLALESDVTVTVPNRSARVAVPVLSTQVPMTL